MQIMQTKTNEDAIDSPFVFTQHNINNGSYKAVGQSVHIASNCSTLWNDVQLVFKSTSEQKVEITGAGSSKCGSSEIPFVLFGEYYPKLGMGRLTKVHMNISTENSIIYHLTAVPSKSRKCVAKMKLFNETVDGSLRIFKA